MSRLSAARALLVVRQERATNHMGTITGQCRRDRGVAAGPQLPNRTERDWAMRPATRELDSQRPLLSAVVPAYNAARYIGETIRSLVSQTYPNMEIVIVDDGSSDETVLLVREWARSYPQIRLIQQGNKGVAAARNRGLEMSLGELIAPVDADDIWFPEAAEKLANRLLQSDDSVGVAYCWAVTIDERGLLDGGFRSSMIEGDVFNSLCAHNFIGNASSTVIRRACIEEVGGYDGRFHEENAQGCEDWDLYLRIAEGFHFGVVPEFLVGYRRSGGSMSSDASSMARSHAYLLRKTSSRRPNIPRVLYRMSTSGLYLYLAQECGYRGMLNESHYWWFRALVEGRLFSLLRPSCYTLAFRNAMAFSSATLGRLIWGANAASRRPNSPPLAGMRKIRIEDIARRRARIQTRILLQDIFHRMVSRMSTA